MYSQHKFDYLIYEFDSFCHQENVIRIDYNCIEKDSIGFLSKIDIEYLSDCFDTNLILKDTDLSMLPKIYKDNEFGSRLLYQSSSSETIIYKYLTIISYVERILGDNNMTLFTYSLHNPTNEKNNPTKCDQQIGFGFSWDLNYASEELNIYLSTEFKELKLYVDFVKY
jgi:hypothetical protein